MFGQIHQTITTPLGINVFGSATIRVEPDIASIDFSTSRLEQQPKPAFQWVKQAAQSIREYLKEGRFENVGTSRVNLKQEFKHGEFAGYRARASFNVLLHDLDRLEELLTGVVDAGVTRIGTITFHTTLLKEIRADARQRAVGAAREKAQLYCEAAGVELGSVIHIEDVNPESLRGWGGHTRPPMPQLDDEGPLQAFDPGSIVVHGAVMIAFEIQK